MTDDARQRPSSDMPERELVDSLDELEARAKSRLSGGESRAALTGSLNLTWSDQEPGYHYYWHSDSDNIKLTFSDLLNNGYEFVRYKHGAHAGEKVVKKRGGTSNYLMRIPNALHEENQLAIRKDIARKETDLNNVGSREYAGDSKELGKGTAVKADYTESPLLGN